MKLNQPLWGWQLILVSHLSFGHGNQVRNADKFCTIKRKYFDFSVSCSFVWLTKDRSMRFPFWFSMTLALVTFPWPKFRFHLDIFYFLSLPLLLMMSWDPQTRSISHSGYEPHIIHQNDQSMTLHWTMRKMGGCRDLLYIDLHVANIDNILKITLYSIRSYRQMVNSKRITN